MKIDVKPVGLVCADLVSGKLNGVAWGCMEDHPIHNMLENGWEIHSLFSHRDEKLNCTTIAAVLIKKTNRKEELSGGPEDPAGD